MLTLKLIEKSTERVMYAYYPEDGDAFGIISVDVHTGDINVIDIARNDRHKRYLSHAISKITQLSNSGKYEDKVSVAWY